MYYVLVCLALKHFLREPLSAKWHPVPVQRLVERTCVEVSLNVRS